MDKVCSCHSCSNLNKIDFLAKTAKHSSEEHVEGTSLQPFNRLPDEVLTHILNYIPPVNIDNFITFIALEMVSKRFRRCVADNKKILEEMTELVIGLHPDLPADQYLCHIGHFTLELFLRRVKKITKVIVNINEDWLCPEVMKKGFLPIAIDRFGGKIELHDLTLRECQSVENRLVKKLINNAEQFLESAQITIKSNTIKPIIETVAKCSLLKNLKLSFNGWNYFRYIEDLAQFIDGFKSLEVLEIDGYIASIVASIMRLPLYSMVLGYEHLHLRQLRFTDPRDDSTHGIATLEHVKNMFAFPSTSSIRELEIDLCAHSNNLTHLPHLLENVHHSMHLKITFLPYLEFNKLPKIVELLENSRQKKCCNLTISLTFKHSHSVIDRESKLAIVYHLLNAFDVPYMAEEESWEFIRGKLCVNLKLEKIDDESLICHPHPLVNQ